MLSKIYKYLRNHEPVVALSFLGGGAYTFVEQAQGNLQGVDAWFGVAAAVLTLVVRKLVTSPATAEKLADVVPEQAVTTLLGTETALRTEVVRNADLAHKLTQLQRELDDLSSVKAVEDLSPEQLAWLEENAAAYRGEQAPEA